MEKQVYAYVESCDKLTGSASTSHFKVNLDLPHGHEWQYVALEKLHFMKGYYMLDSSNNTITCTERVGVTNDSITATISAGNYSGSTLSSALKSALETASAATGNTLTYTVTYSSTSGKFTIDNGDTGNTWQIDSGTNMTLAKYLGIETTQVDSVLTVITSSKIAVLQRYCAVYLRSSLAQNGNSNILEQILCSNTQNNDFFEWQPTELAWVKCVNGDSPVHEFMITERDGTAIELNGADVIFTLAFKGFKCMY